MTTPLYDRTAPGGRLHRDEQSPAVAASLTPLKPTRQPAAHQMATTAARKSETSTAVMIVVPAVSVVRV